MAPFPSRHAAAAQSSSFLDALKDGEGKRTGTRVEVSKRAWWLAGKAWMASRG